VDTVLAFVGLPGLAPLPWEQMLAIFGYAAVACLVVNDALKVIMIQRLVPSAVSGDPARNAAGGLHCHKGEDIK
jgi:hypothetical protein